MRPAIERAIENLKAGKPKTGYVDRGDDFYEEDEPEEDVKKLIESFEKARREGRLLKTMSREEWKARRAKDD